MSGSSGSGLGLSVVYGVVKDHNGYYDIISNIGEGTEFIIYLPITTVLESIDSDKKQLSITGNEKILVIDDEEQQRELSSRILSSLGYEIIKVENGTKAVEYLKDNKVEIIIIDMIMEPHFDGLDTYREILKIHPNQKAIIVSGFSPTERVEKMLALGSGAYVKKPFTRKSLAQAVRVELDRKAVPTTV
jgi:CheY-like chemotaxis protein